MPLDQRLCKPGDILLFYGLNRVGVGQSIAKGLKVLTVLPGIISAVQHGSRALVGSSTCNHAAIISVNELRRGPGGAVMRGSFDLTHATGLGIVTTSVDNYLLGCTGTCKVFRLSVLTDLAPEAAAVALRWGMEDAEGAGMPFAVGKAFLSALRSSSFGSGAKARAEFYRSNRNRVGGPVDWKNWENGTHKSMFCSMFAIACYQAVMQEHEAGQLLALDAKHTSPMTLDGYLRTSQHWVSVNAMRP